jgi:hypothetical protein
VRLVVFVMAFIAAAASGDVLYLRSGKQYTGTFVSGTKNWIHFSTDAHVRQSFRTRDVERVEFGAKVAPEPEVQRAEPPVEAVPAPPAPPPAPVAVAVPPPSAESAAPEPFPLATAGSGFGAHMPPDSGAVDSVYTALGGPTGPLGEPLSVEKWTPGHRAVVRHFRGGDIYWTDQGGAHAVSGPILDAWLELGGPAARLGFPTGDEQDAEGGYSRRQVFEGGTITWDSTHGGRVQYNPAVP